MLAGVTDGGDHPLDATGAETAGHDHAVEVPEAPFGHEALDLFSLHPVELQLGPVRVAAVAERLDHREVGVGKVDVLADQADPHWFGGGLDPAHQLVPVGTGPRASRRSSGGRHPRRHQGSLPSAECSSRSSSHT